jgi:drug/metabolite transporter (DMT)-like permease
MNYWWVLAIVSGLGLSTRNILFKTVSTKLDAAFSALVLAIGMTVVSVVYYMIQRSVAQEPFVPTTIPLQPTILCLIAGAGVAFANIFLALAYKQGGYASLVAILQNGAAITVTLLIGYLFLAEVVKPMQIVGIVFAFVGVAIIVKG